MPRFVLLYHDCPPEYVRASHWDLMFEVGDSLRTLALRALPKNWHAAHLQTATAFPASPALATENSVSAEPLGDHRREYLRYEGPLSDQRGRVSRIDAGTFKTLAQSEGRWQIKLAGHYIRGAITLTAGAADTKQWTLTSHECD